MSIATRIESIEEHIEQAYDELQGLGADLTNVNKNIENISMVLDDIYDSMPQVSGEGTSLTLDDTRVGKIKSTLKGNTSQFTTTGKNLLPNERATTTENGITITKNDDGTYKVNGTASADVSLAINENTFISMSGTWRMLGCPSGGSASTYMLSAYVGYWGTASPNIDTGNGTNITYTGNVKVRFYIKSGTTCNNLIFKPMLTTDTNTTINDFEPYTGGQASPNPNFPQDIHVVSGDNEINVVGKNLFDVSRLPMTKNGVTISIDNNGNVVLNGTPSISSGYIPFEVGTKILPVGTYTMSVANKIVGIGVTYNDTTPPGWLNLTLSDTTTAKTATITNISGGIFNINVRYDIGTLNNFVLNPQLEKGSSATSYEPYQGNTYNIDLPVENLVDTPSTNSAIVGSGLTYSRSEDGTISVSGTSTRAYDYTLTTSYTFKAGETYTFYCERGGTTNFNYYILFNSNNGGQLTLSYAGNTPKTRTMVEDQTVSIKWSLGNNVAVDYSVKFMIQKGSKANSYTPYGTTPIELCKIGNYQDYIYKGTGKNLLPNNATTQTINGVTFKVNDDKSVTLNGTASAIADFYMFGGSTDTGEYLYIPKGTYSISNPSSGWFYIGREKTLGAVVGNSALLNALSSQDCYFYGFIIRATSGSSFSNLTLFPMINEGTTALPYEPYGSKDKWLLHKEIGKKVFNGTEGGGQMVDNNQRIMFGSSNVPELLDVYINKADSVANFTPSLCDYFQASFQNDLTPSNTKFAFSKWGATAFIYFSAIYNSVADFKTWLSTHNVVVYYVLVTPTNTKITYEPLLEQLEAYYHAKSRATQTNISQVNNDLPFIISASALKEWQENTSLNSTLSMVNPLSLGNTLNTQENDIQPIEVDNIEPLEEEENEES